MKAEMVGFDLVGSQQSRATNWLHWPGLCHALLSDGRRVYGSPDTIPAALDAAERAGADTTDMRIRLRVWVLCGTMPLPHGSAVLAAEWAARFENEACGKAVQGATKAARKSLAKAIRLWRIAGKADRAKWALRHVYSIRGDLAK